MAGGIDWFRWHHGSVTDPKFQLVAKRADARLSDVLAVWAFMLEKASASSHRGVYGDLDHEAIDCLFGLEDGTAQRIEEQMQARCLVDGGEIVAWDKRQPQREREDNTAAERKQRQREKQATDSTNHVSVTPCHATSHQKTPRGEESREEVLAPNGACPQAELDDAAEAPGIAHQGNSVPDCPARELVDLYHERLPMLRRCEVLNDARRGFIRQRWREVCIDLKLKTKADALDWFGGYFETVKQSEFLTGRTARSNGHAFQADLEWLMRPNNFAKVVEGKYA